MKILLHIVFLFFVALSASGQQKKTRILFILDASNSMNLKWGQETRIQAAKEQLIKCIDSLEGSANLEIALRVYGHQSLVTATYQDCNDTKLEVPFGPNNYQAVRSKVKSITAKGTTPIARSLEAAAGDFPDTTTRNVIILITDGLEACDNDPCVIAKKLHDKGVNITPFVIGLGLDLSYLEQFKCIGSYSEAETKASFRNALNGILAKVLFNTTVQINLNNIDKKPLETNVTMLLYKAGTKELKYTLVHTLNRLNLPDTIVINPEDSYDIVVNTIPKVEKKGVKIVKNMHNTIVIDCPQGYIKPKFVNATKPYNVDVRVYQPNSPVTLNNQQVGTTDKYIVGKYEVEILTLPRIYKTVEVTQNSTQQIDIEAPGMFQYAFGKELVAQIFVLKSDGNLEWVCNLDQTNLTGLVFLQPGSYRLVYRQKALKSTSYTSNKDFKIVSNKTLSINL
ncbi:MAG: vWA domain-containing protein [Fluviicola sp.]|jgi:Ca-activated chloride channel family protein